MNALALSRFQLASYVRSYRVLQPLVAALLLLTVVAGGAGSIGSRSQPVLDAYGNLAMVMFPVWAWAARQLLDSEPDVQRELSLTAVGSRARTIGAGLLGAYALNVAFVALVVAVVAAGAFPLGVGPRVHLFGVAVLLLTALPATAVGACTSRAMIPSPGASVLTLLGACVAIALGSLTPAAGVLAPMAALVRGAYDGAGRLSAVLPATAASTVAWSCVVALGYALARRTHP